MSVYVLIHGAWHGGWCWDRVVPLLKRAGHSVEAPDLPGHGRDRTPIPEISLQSYAERVCEVLDAQPEPVILVGHSMGGIVITQTAEYRPDRVRTLVYLCAFLPRNGESLLQLAQTDSESLVLPNLAMASDQSSTTVRDEAIKEAFYADCSDEDVTWATSRLVPDPLAPMTTPVSTTPGNFGRVPKVYIECRQDRAIPISLQKRMYMASPCQQIISMDTSHSPFLSAPERLVEHLTSLPA